MFGLGKFASCLLAIVLTISFSLGRTGGERLVLDTCSECKRWWRLVVSSDNLTPVEPDQTTARDPGLATPITIDTPQLSEAELINAATCLLKLKGNKTDSRIRGATSLDVSTTFGTSSVEVASLYYISYLYYGRWNHASAAVLVDDKGRMNTDESIKKAYLAYHAWLVKVKDIGLNEVRKAKLDPLDGSGVKWY